MKQLELRSGKMPVIGFGTWRLTGREATTMCDAALSLGYRHIDTAQIYENEEEVGSGIQNSGVDRESIFLTTKVWTTNFKKAALLKSVEESLTKLKTPYLDLLLLHWPNPEVELSESIDGLLELLGKGVARDIGVSNFPIALLKEAIKLSGGAVCCNQVEFHPLIDQSKLHDFQRSHGIALTAYSPLARSKLMDTKVIMEIASNLKKTPAQVILRWSIEKGVSVIPKTSSKERAKENFEIFDFELTEKQTALIDAMRSPSGRQISPEFAPEWDS